MNILKELWAVASIRVIAIDDYGSFATVDREGEEQGKGEGPSA